jgi:hypothetical protein
MNQIFKQICQDSNLHESNMHEKNLQTIYMNQICMNQDKKNLSNYIDWNLYFKNEGDSENLSCSNGRNSAVEYLYWFLPVKVYTNRSF